MKRYVGIGAIVGVVVGFVIQFFFPSILNFELVYNIVFRKQTGIPIYPTSSGSVYAVGSLFPLLTGIIGGVVAMVVYKLAYGKPNR